MLKTGLATLLLCSCLVALAVPTATAEPQVYFTRVPLQGAGSDSRGDIAGTVSGVDNPEQYKVVVYARANQWYVQPTTDNPYTSIAADGSWTTWTHLGDRYAVLLVEPSFQPPSTAGSLPEVGDEVIARVQKNAKKMR